METFEIAHLNIQNVNVIIAFFSTNFDRKTPGEQHKIQAQLQFAASQAGLAGNLVPVWRDHFGRMKFIAPPQQHPFFSSSTYEDLALQINRTLTVQ